METSLVNKHDLKGVTVYTFMSWFTRRPSKKSKSNKSGSFKERKRVRKNSNRSYNAHGSEAGSGIYRNYNWVELQRQSVSDQDSVVTYFYYLYNP